MCKNAHVHILASLDKAVDAIPYAIAGLDFDNGSEFMNHDVIGWSADRDIVFTRSRPYKKNDQAAIEWKNNHLVRRYAYCWRYDTPEAMVLLNQLWLLVNDRLNYFTRPASPSDGAPTPRGGPPASMATPPPHCSASWPPACSHLPSRPS